MWKHALTEIAAVVAQAADPLAPFGAEPAAGTGSAFALGLPSAWLSVAMVIAGLGLFAAVWLSTRRVRSARGPTPESTDRMTTTHPLVESWHTLRAWTLVRLGVHSRDETGSHLSREGGGGRGGHDESLARQEQRVLSLSRDLEDLAQRLAVEMDARAGRMETLIAEARAAADRLEALDRGPTLEQIARRHAVVTRPEPVHGWLETQTSAGVPRAEVLVGSGSAAPSPSREQSREQAGQQTHEPMRKPIMTGVVTGGWKPGAEAATDTDTVLQAAFAGARPSGEALQSQIARLAAQGLSADQIAHKLGQHVGKVELVLALRRM